MRALDLGCGAAPKNPFNVETVYGVDFYQDLDKNIIKADLAIESIPFSDGYFDIVTAHDFIEHIPRLVYLPQRRNSFIELMNEIYRVLKPGGKFYSETPAFPHHAAFWDPTHVNIITEQTWPYYFGADYLWAKVYGFTGNFIIVEQHWRGPHLIATLSKV